MGRVTINDREYVFKPGETILHAARSLGFDVPTLCHDERLRPFGGCRLCVVEVKDAPQFQTSCNTELHGGMVIRTHSAEIEAHRRALLQLLAAEVPRHAMRRSYDHPFFKYIRRYQLEDSLRGSREPALFDDSHPYIRVDMSQCIYCSRCVQICDELQGQNVWSAWFRGDATRIRPASGDNLRTSECVSCGACADTCPTGAIRDWSAFEYEGPLQWTRTICPYCGVGCEMNVGGTSTRVVQIRPVQESAVSKGHLCVKGRYAFDFVSAPDRITRPMIRNDGVWRTASWPEALKFTARKLEQIISKFGPESVGLLGSSRSTNEENYLAQKFARVCLGTNNVDCCARVCHAPSAAAMKEMMGAGAATNSFDDVERASTFLICGANPTENHPIVGARIRQAARRGARLIVIDPRRIELADEATIHLQVVPGTNAALLNAMANVIVEDAVYDYKFVNDRASGWEDYSRFIQQCSPESAAPICGIKAEDIRRAARLYASNGPAMIFHGLGTTEHVQGTEGVKCLVNLALLTGNIGRPGSGVNPLRGQNNVQGAAHMGCNPRLLTGGVPVSSSARFSEAWRAPIPGSAGLNLLQMIDAAAAGRLKALWVIGYDIALTNPNSTKTLDALRSLDCVIVQDMFMTETARQFATVFLPAASSFEKDGTFMNSERRIQRVRRAIDPIDESRSDWEILCDTAKEMGKGHLFDYGSVEDIWNEIRTVWPNGQGITYDRLEHQGLQWPCPTEQHPGTSILHQESFADRDRASLQPVQYRPASEQTDPDFPFILITGRVLYQFNAGTMTLRTRNAVLHPCDVLEISSKDAAALEIREGDLVQVTSRHGSISVAARIDDRLRPGVAFTTFHTADALTNTLTGHGCDPVTNTPEYKVTAVRLARVA